MPTITDDRLAGSAKRVGILFHCGRDLVACCHIEIVLECLNYHPPAWTDSEKDELRRRIFALGKDGLVNTGGRSHRWTKCCPLRLDSTLLHAKDLMHEHQIAGDVLICSTEMIRAIWDRCGHDQSKATVAEIDDTRRVLLNFRKDGKLKMETNHTHLFGDDQ